MLSTYDYFSNNPVQMKDGMICLGMLVFVTPFEPVEKCINEKQVWSFVYEDVNVSTISVSHGGRMKCAIILKMLRKTIKLNTRLVMKSISARNFNLFSPITIMQTFNCDFLQDKFNNDIYLIFSLHLPFYYWFKFYTTKRNSLRLKKTHFLINTKFYLSLTARGDGHFHLEKSTSFEYTFLLGKQSCTNIHDQKLNVFYDQIIQG